MEEFIMKKFKDNNKGFSLVELIVVIAIMVVLIAVLGSTILGYVDKSKHAKDISALDSINTAVKTFVGDPNNTAPDGQYTLSDLVTNYDSGNVILPILAEAFAVGGKTSSSTGIADIEFNNASKTFEGLKLKDIKVVIIDGAVSVYAPVKAGKYDPYNAGTAFDKEGNTKVAMPTVPKSDS